MADANRVQASYLAETTWGTTPSSAFRAFPITGGSFATGVQTVRSSQIRNDAQQADMKRVGITPTASYDFELTAQNYDEFMKSALRSSAWSSLSVTGSNIEVTITLGVVKILQGAGTNFASVADNSWVYVSGFTTAGNNGWKKVLDVTDSGAGFTIVNNTGMAVEAAGDTVSVKGGHISNGTATDSYTLQQSYEDLYVDNGSSNYYYHLMTCLLYTSPSPRD